MQKRIIRAAGMAVSLGMLANLAAAQEKAYPSRPITLVTPYATGGGADVLARALAEALRRNLGQAVVVRNIEGAGGVIGARFVANAAPDGYTLLSHNNGMALAPALYKDLQYDPIKSFAPIGLWADNPLIFISNRNFPPNNVKELIDYAKRNKDKVTFGSSGMGSTTHLCSMQFEKVIGSNVTVIQYKGAAPAFQDVLGGRVDILCSGATASITSQVREGALKAFMQMGAKRLESLPTVPTSTEAGLPELALTAWYGLYAPAGTPPAIVSRLSAALQAIVQDPVVKAQVAKMETVLMEPKQATPAALQEMLSTQMELWRPLIQKAMANAN